MSLRTPDTIKLPDLLNNETSQVTFAKTVKKVICSHKELADRKTHKVIFSGKGFENTFIAQRGDIPGKLNELSALDPIGLLKKNCPPGFSDMNFIYKEYIPQYSQLTSQGKDEFFFTHFNYDEQQNFTPGYIDGDDRNRIEDLAKMQETSDKTVANLQEQIKFLEERKINIDIEKLDNENLTLKLKEVNEKFDEAEKIINKGNNFFLSNILNAVFQDISNDEKFTQAESRIYEASKVFNDGSGLLRFITEYLDLRKTERERRKLVKQQEERLIIEREGEDSSGGRRIIRRKYKRKRGGGQVISTKVSISNDFTSVINQGKKLMAEARFKFSEDLTEDIEKTQKRKNIIEEQLAKMKRYIYEKKITTLLDSSENDIKSGIKQNEENPSNIESIKTKFNQAEKNLDDADSNLQILVNSFTNTKGNITIIGYTDKEEDSKLKDTLAKLKKRYKKVNNSLNDLRRIVRNCDAGNNDKTKCNAIEGCEYDDDTKRCMTLENFNKIHLKRLQDDLDAKQAENDNLKKKNNELTQRIKELEDKNKELEESNKTIHELQSDLERAKDTIKKNKERIEELEKQLEKIKKELEKFNKDLKVANKRIEELEEQLKRLKEEYEKEKNEKNTNINNLNKENERLKKELETEISEKNQLRLIYLTRITLLKKKQTNNNSNYANLSETNQNLETENKNLKNQLLQQQQKNDYLQKKIEEDKKQISALEGQVRVLDLRVNEAEEKAKESEARAKDAAAQLEEKDAKIAKLELEIEKITNENTTLRSELKDAQEQLSQSRKEVEELKSKVNELEARIQELNTELEELKKKNRELESENDSLKNENRKLKVSVKFLQLSIAGLKIKMREKETKYQESLRELKDENNELKQQNNVLQEKIEYLNKQLEDLENQLKKSRVKEEEAEKSQKNLQKEIYRLREQISITNINNEEYSSLETQIYNLELNLTKTKTELLQYESDNTILEKKIQKLNLENSTYKANQDNLQLNLDQLQANLLKAQADRIEAIEQAKAANIAQISAEEARIAAQKATSFANTRAFNSEVEAAEAKYAAQIAIDRANELEIQINAMNAKHLEKMKDLQAQLNESQTKLYDSERTIDNQNNVIQELKDKIINLESENESLNANIGILKGEKIEKERQNQELSALNEELQDKLKNGITGELYKDVIKVIKLWIDIKEELYGLNRIFQDGKPFANISVIDKSLGRSLRITPDAQTNLNLIYGIATDLKISIMKKDNKIIISDNEKPHSEWIIGEASTEAIYNNQSLPGITGYPVLGFLIQALEKGLKYSKQNTNTDSFGGSLSRKTKLKLRFSRQKNKKSKRKLKKYIFKRKTYKNNKKKKKTTKRKKKLYI